MQEAPERQREGVGTRARVELRIVNNLACLYLHQGKMQEAEAMFRRVLEGNEKSYVERDDR